MSESEPGTSQPSPSNPSPSLDNSNPAPNPSPGPASSPSGPAPGPAPPGPSAPPPHLDPPPGDSPDVKQQQQEEPRPDGQPPKKRQKLCKEVGKLEQRLGGILCCAVCLDLPRTAVYQCTNGHLMCAGCFTHLLADARLRDEVATCPNCRVEISRTLASRNLAVEKAVNELPADCQYCGKQFPRNSLDWHEKELCEERTTFCKYSRIGCPWRGPFHEVAAHESTCAHPSKSGSEVMDTLKAIDQKLEDEKARYDSIFDLLSYEKITFHDLQLKPYRTDEFVHKLFYETSRFSAFNNQWVIKARINNNQRDPTQSCERQMTYQKSASNGDEGNVWKSMTFEIKLIVKTKPTSPLDLHFVIVKGPFGDMHLQPTIYRGEFSDQNNESPYIPLALADTAECNRLLACKTISFRLIMFLVCK